MVLENTATKALNLTMERAARLQETAAKLSEIVSSRVGEIVGLIPSEGCDTCEPVENNIDGSIRASIASIEISLEEIRGHFDRL